MKKRVILIEESKISLQGAESLDDNQMLSLRGGEICVCDANPFDPPCLCNVARPWVICWCRKKVAEGTIDLG